MPVIGPLVSADVKVMGDQAFCHLVNRTGGLVRFRLPKATVVVPGNSEGNVVAEFVDGFCVSTEEHGLLFGEVMKVTRSGQPWNVRDTEFVEAPAATGPVAVVPPVEVVNPKPVVEVEVDPDVAEMTVSEVLAWVGDNADRKKVALKAEVAGKARKGLIATLSA